ncbi:MAG: S8 family serine peptidase [Spirulina sp.]
MLLVLNLLLNLFRRSEQSQKPSEPYFQAFILEPILTPSALLDNPLDGQDAPDIDAVDIQVVEIVPPSLAGFEGGTFVVGESGEVGIEFLFDGGKYKGELGIFSLEGMEDLEPGSQEFIAEAAERAFSNTEEGYIAISDRTERALFDGTLGEKTDWNAGEYKGVKTFKMEAGTKFGVILVPNGTVKEVMDNPDIGGAKTPLFSLATGNPDDGLHLGQIVDVDGEGNTFVMEDLRMDRGSDRDYNDFIFRVTGATGEASDMDDFIDPDLDWRETETGLEIIDYITMEDVEKESQPFVGVIDTGFSDNNPDLDYSRITLGSDFVDGDGNPLLSEGEGNEHGTHVLGIIGATQDNDLGIDGIDDDVPLWVGRSVGSGKWADSLWEFVEAAQESGHENAVVNLSLDLTQIDSEGNVTTRYEFTTFEREAIEYARQNGVLIVASAGNDGGVMSVLGQASQEFDNIITVGAADGAGRAEYSSYGQGLDILANGGTVENPVLSLTGEDVGTMAGTSVATAQVTGAISLVWAANPELSYRQVKDILRETATDLGEDGWDLETGAGLLNLAAAVALAKEIQGEDYDPVPWFAPESWSGEGKFEASDRAANGTHSTGSQGGGIPTDKRNFVETVVSNGVKLYYYEKGYIMEQPSGHQTWYALGTGLPAIGRNYINPVPRRPIPGDPDGNGTFSNAEEVEQIDRLSDSIGNGDLNDYYTFTLDESQYVNIQLDGLSADANIELIQKNHPSKPSNILADSTNPDTTREVISRDLEPGTYFIRVYSENNQKTTYDLQIRSRSRNVQPDNGSPATTPDPVYFADVTGDGKGDATVVNNDKVTVRRSTGSDFGENESANEDWTDGAYFGSKRTHFADVNGDGKSDAIVVNEDGVYVKLSDGSNFGETEKWTNIPYYSLANKGEYFADVTGDGKADAIVVNENGVYVRESEGNKFADNATNWTENAYYSIDDKAMAFADVDGDGKADAIVVNNSGVYVRRSNGSSFEAHENWTNEPYFSTGGKGEYFADVDGDGRADAIVVNNDGVYVRRSNGSEFLPDEKWTDNPYFSIDGKGSYFVDVNNDGMADAVVVNNSNVTVRRSTGINFGEGSEANEDWTTNPYYSVTGLGWQNPLPGYPTTDEFGPRDESGWGGDGWHNGIDIATYGTTPPVKAAKSGTVVFAGLDSSGYGKLVKIDHGDGTMSYYAHLSHISVSYGQTVAGGSYIGNVGATGTAFGANPEHLHFEIRVSPYGYGLPNSKNPRDYIQF